MAATSKVSVLFHMRKEDLEKQMNDTDDKRSYEHLLAIKLAYDGKTQKEIASALSRSLTTIYHWLNDWNENGLYGIFPNFGGGYASNSLSFTSPFLLSVVHEIAKSR